MDKVIIGGICLVIGEVIGVVLIALTKAAKEGDEMMGIKDQGVFKEKE